MTDSSQRTAIRGGLVVDGTGRPGYRADVLVVDDRIATIAREGLPVDLPAHDLDARGLVVAPGFVDVHAHADITLLAFPGAESATRQGITTVVNGNCGLGPAPLEPDRDFRRVTIAFEPAWEVDVSWRSFGEYVARLDGLGVNVAMLVPHGAVRNAVMGLERRAPTAAELGRMVTLVDEAMQAGAVGVSTGLEYQPGCFAQLEELVAVAAAAAHHGGVYATHIRDRGERFAAATQEATAVARLADVRLQLSHFAPRPYAPRTETDAAMAAVDALADAGHPVGVDTFPEVWGPGLLLHLLPEDVADAPPAEVAERLADDGVRARVREHFERGENFLARAGGYERIFVTSSPAAPDDTGRSLSELADEARLDVGTWACDALRAAGGDLGAVGIRHLYAREDDLRALLRRPDCSLGSDGVVTCHEGGECPYPWNASSYGYAARTLGHYVRELGLLPLEDAVRRLSALPAEAMALDDRGLIVEGRVADLVVFDGQTIADRSTPDDVARHPAGIEHVLIGGRPVVLGGGPQPTRPGRFVAVGGTA